LRHAHHSAVAALSAAHLSAIPFLDTLRRLYIARDSDPAGDGAMITLVVLSPRLDDFNLRQLARLMQRFDEFAHGCAGFG
jgi:hypothetical protein